MDRTSPDPVFRPTAVYGKKALLPQGWCDDVRIEITSGRISRMAIGVAAETEDQHAVILLPGMANLHSHAFQRGMAGLAERRGPAGDSFWTWREVMYHFVARLTPDDLQAIAAQAYVEMLEAGFTRVAEFHYLHHAPDGRYDDPAEMSARIVAAAAESGIGLTLLPVFYAQGGFGARPPSAAQQRFLSDPDSYARLLAACRDAVRILPDAVVGIAPHSLRAVTEQQLALILPLAGDGPIHIHIAEQMREVEDCLAWSGARPVEWLLTNAPVDRRWCLVHATHVSDSERQALARSGAVAGLCPITEANLGDGLFPLEKFRAEGGVLGVGSDSNVLICLAEELRLLEYGQRLLHQGRNLAASRQGQSTGRALFDAALSGGAQATGGSVGIEIGAAADLVALNEGHPALLARSDDAWLDSFIFAGNKDMVTTVWRAGKAVVTAGRHHRRDAARARYRAVLQRLLA